MIGATAASSLAAAATIGDYFVVESGPLTDQPWRPFTELCHDPSVIAERVDFVRRTLSARTGLDLCEIDSRACASTHFLGLASRLIAPPLATLALRGLVIGCSPGDLRWQAVDGGPIPIGYVAACVHPAATVTTAAAALCDLVVEPLIRPLVQAFGDVSPIVLWGNVASALAGAAGMLVRSGEPFVLDPSGILTALLTRGPLAGTGSIEAPDRLFRRASCCLFYRIPGGGTCGDCILT